MVVKVMKYIRNTSAIRRFIRARSAKRQSNLAIATFDEHTTATEKPRTIAMQITMKRKKYIYTEHVLGTKVNNMASRVKGLVCTYRSHDFGGGGRSRVLVS